MDERREAKRQKSFLRGFVYVDKRRGAISCLIRDLSENGARIVFSESVAVPDILALHIPQKEQTVQAEVEWRRGDEIGLKFVAPPRAAEAAPEAQALTRRVAQLENEIASLRRMVKQLNGKTGKPGDFEAA
jgi:hypothetical protein